MVERLGEMRKGRRERIEKRSRERIIEKKKETKRQFEEKEGLRDPLHQLRINTSLVSSGQTLYQAAPLETNTSLLQHFTAESSPELRRNAVP